MGEPEEKLWHVLIDPFNLNEFACGEQTEKATNRKIEYSEHN